MYLGQVVTTPPTTASTPTVAESITALLPGLLQAYQQRKVIKAQTARMEQGLPPLPVEEYIPPVRVQAGIDPKTIAMIGIPLALAVLLLMRR